MKCSKVLEQQKPKRVFFFEISKWTTTTAFDLMRLLLSFTSLALANTGSFAGPSSKAIVEASMTWLSSRNQVLI
jgi:hypothetical protein